MLRLACFPAIFRFTSKLGLPLRCSSSFKSLPLHAQNPNSGGHSTNSSALSRLPPHASARACDENTESSKALFLHAQIQNLCVSPRTISWRPALRCEENSNSFNGALQRGRELWISRLSFSLLRPFDRFCPLLLCGRFSRSFGACSRVCGGHLDWKGLLYEKNPNSFNESVRVAREVWYSRSSFSLLCRLGRFFPLSLCGRISKSLRAGSAVFGGHLDWKGAMGKKRRQAATDEDVEDVKEKSGGEKDLYEVLGVDRKASQEEIRKAYHKLALRLHPDKNPDDETAKDKFQSLQSVIAILGDAEKRKVYDETGSVEDVLSGDTFKNLYHFFKSLFKQVSEEDIDAFAASYRGSKEEALNLKDEYRRRKGNMNLVFTFIMCSNPKLDSHRYMDIIDAAIAAGEMKEFKAYRKWAAGVAKEPAPLKPLAQTNRKKKDNGEPSSSLMSLISGRGKDRMNSLASALEAKYGGGKKNKHAKVDHEPSEEEFQAAQKRAMKKVKTKGSKQD